MEYVDIKKTLPDTPGVYLFKKGNTILYVGRATSLRDRVRSYFASDIVKARGPLIARMIDAAESVSVRKTDSVLEALLREAELIKKHQPRYNTEGKDDKSYNYIVITDEEFPRVLCLRERELSLKDNTQKSKAEFGPFPHSGQLKEALRIVRKIFPFRDKCSPPTIRRPASNSLRPCFNRQIGLCPGVCTGEISKKEYAKIIRHLRLFFEGKKKQLVKKLERGMKAYAKRQEFEKAAETKKTIFALNHIQDVSLFNVQGSTSHKGESPKAFRIEGYDVAHTSGTGTVGVMVVVEGGETKRSDYRKFKIRGEKRSDTGALKEILRRRFAHNEWPLPRLVVVDGGKAQKNSAERVVKEYGYVIPVTSVVKDERHKPREILGERRHRQKHERDILLANAEAHRFALAYHKKTRKIHENINT